MVKRIIAALLLFSAVNGQAQVNNSASFTAFGNQYDSLFRIAYDHLDTNRYQQLLNTFIGRYNNLDSTTKKANAGRLSVALYNLCCIYSLQNTQAQALTYLERAIHAGVKNSNR